MTPTDLIALAVEELERAVAWYTAFARPDRAAQLREAIELVKRVPEIVAERDALRAHLLEIHALGCAHSHEAVDIGLLDPHLDNLTACCVDGIRELLEDHKKVRPRTLGVDGPPKDYPVLVFFGGKLEWSFVHECHLREEYAGKWLREEGELEPMNSDDKYVYLRPLLELDHG